MIPTSRLSVWWETARPVGGTSFSHRFGMNVRSVIEGVNLLESMRETPAFNDVKSVGLDMWVDDCGDGAPGWVNWYDAETWIDDPFEYVAMMELEGEGA
jgi:hypothetical protein